MNYQATERQFRELRRLHNVAQSAPSPAQSLTTTLRTVHLRCNNTVTLKPITGTAQPC